MIDDLDARQVRQCVPKADPGCRHRGATVDRGASGDHREDLVSGLGGAGGVAPLHAASSQVLDNTCGDLFIPRNLVLVHSCFPPTWSFRAPSPLSVYASP